MMKPLAIHVYEEMLKQAEIYRQKAKTYSPSDHDIGDKEFYENLSLELYHWVAELEKTPEINPPK